MLEFKLIYETIQRMDKQRPHVHSLRRHITRDMQSEGRVRLLLLLLLATLLLLCGSRGALALDAAWPSTTIRRSEGEIDVFLRVEANHERRYVNNLFADAIGEKV